MNLKQKNIALLSVFLVLLWITYHFSISKTIEAKSKYDSLTAQKDLVSNVNEQMHYLNQQNVYLDSILNKNKIATESSFQNNLLTLLNSFAAENKLEIIFFNEPHTYNKKDAVLKTYSFTVKGNYNKILKLIYTLENYGNYGQPVSVNFDKKKNYKTNRKYLECVIHLQRIEETFN